MGFSGPLAVSSSTIEARVDTSSGKERKAIRQMRRTTRACNGGNLYWKISDGVPVEMTPGYTNDSAKLPTTPELRDTWKQRHEEHKDAAEQNPQTQMQTKNESPSETQMETQQQTESQMTEKETKSGGVNNEKNNNRRNLQVFFCGESGTPLAVVLMLVLVTKRVAHLPGTIAYGVAQPA